MTRAQWLALLLGVLLLTAPLIRAEEEEYEDDDDDTGGDAKDGDDKDVVVITKDNFDEKIKKSKFALVGGPPGRRGDTHWLPRHDPSLDQGPGGQREGRG